jgi:hypothetical protein
MAKRDAGFSFLITTTLPGRERPLVDELYKKKPPKIVDPKKYKGTTRRSTLLGGSPKASNSINFHH